MSPAPENSISSREAVRAPAPLLCYVTDRNSLSACEGDRVAGLLRQIRAAIEAGVDWIQIREKDLPTRELFALVERAVQASESGNDTAGSTARRPQAARTKLIVNDRLDIAIAAFAAGVHLGRESAPVGAVVQACRNGSAPGEFLIGVSCHCLAEACEAERAGASYVTFGPVFDTPSKRVFGEPVGIAQLTKVCGALRIPVLAIGGVTAQNAGECVRAGATGLAAIRMFQDAADVDGLRNAIELLRDGDSPTR